MVLIPSLPSFLPPNFYLSPIFVFCLSVFFVVRIPNTEHIKFQRILLSSITVLVGNSQFYFSCNSQLYLKHHIIDIQRLKQGHMSTVHVNSSCVCILASKRLRWEDWELQRSLDNKVKYSFKEHAKIINFVNRHNGFCLYIIINGMKKRFKNSDLTMIMHQRNAVSTLEI